MRFEEHVIEEGSGDDAIILVHGSYASPAAWKGMVAALAQRHRCLLVKLPGHAGTPMPVGQEEPGFEPEFDLLDWVIANRTEGRAHLVGHSFGGAAAMAYALRRPASLRALTLFEPVACWILRDMGDTDSARAVDRVRRALRRDIAEGVPYACGQIIDFWGGLGSFDALPDRVKDAMTALERENLRHWEICRALESADCELAYRSLGFPTRLVHGDRSNPIAGRIVEALARCIPDSETITVAGASHFLVTTHPERCASEVLAAEHRAQRLPMCS